MKLRLPNSVLGWVARCATSIIVAAIGISVVLGCDHYWQSKIASVPIVGGGYPPITVPAFNSITGDLLFGALPFVALAVATLSRAAIGRPN